MLLLFFGGVTLILFHHQSPTDSLWSAVVQYKENEPIYFTIQVKNRAWSPSLLPFPSLCHVFYIILYCTVLYCTLLSSPLLFILQKLTCFESLTGRARLHPDTLLSLLRRSHDSLVFFESRLHAESSSQLEKTKKTADESRNSGIHWTLDTGHWTLHSVATQDKITMKRNQST